MAVFGSSILKEELIDSLGSKRIINMHLGLSPYYRGSGTNFWPLYNEEPQYVGATIHYIDKGIDSGKVIGQVQPEITSEDTPHSIGNKTIIAGTRLLSQVLARLEKGERLEGQAQDLTEGKLYFFKDCRGEHIVELIKKWPRVLKEYLANKDGLAKVKLINQL